MHELIDLISAVVWGPHTLILLVGTGAYFTFRLHGIQVRRLWESLRQMASGWRSKPAEGEGAISPFRALMVALAGAIGNGNIAGVATAITLGGPGAVFWMWLSAFLGMATMYAESVLGVKYRRRDAQGNLIGGPMYYIEQGLGWRWLAVVFAFFMGIKALFSTTLLQSNSIALALNHQTGLPAWVSGLGLAVITWLVIIGGIRRIGRFASAITPFMALLYVAFALAILVIHWARLPAAFALIMKGAFSSGAVVGGGAGVTVLMAARYGVARGVYSNEAGTGSAPVAHAAAAVRHPVEQGILAMMGVWVDTFIICSMTALVLLVSGVWQTGVTSTAATAEAFQQSLPFAGGWIVAISSLLFGYSTLISWPYYGEQCFAYLFGPRVRVPYRWAFCLLILLGASTRVETVWNLGDILNGLMTLPNLIGILGLSGVVVGQTRAYFQAKKPTEHLTT